SGRRRRQALPATRVGCRRWRRPPAAPSRSSPPDAGSPRALSRYRLRRLRLFAGGLDRFQERRSHLGHALAGDAGEHEHGALGRPGELAAEVWQLLARDRVGLVEADDLGLLREAVAVGRELGADRAIGADHVLLRAVDQMQDHSAALGMAEEAVAEPCAVAGALDEAR